MWESRGSVFKKFTKKRDFGHLRLPVSPPVPNPQQNHKTESTMIPPSEVSPKSLSTSVDEVGRR